jgi:hypothetical protein
MTLDIFVPKRVQFDDSATMTLDIFLPKEVATSVVKIHDHCSDNRYV